MPKLYRHYVSKPWGTEDVPPAFAAPAGERIGEIWFQESQGRDLPLLVKYLFTTECLSVQVHPDDAQARAIGKPRGKQECWYILDCEPGAVIGLGFRKAISEETFRASIHDGSVVELMNLHRVKPGDFFFIPAGTVHAIGAGITLVEFQQNSDITYRLYDYCRPRELHVEAGVAVSRLAKYDGPFLEAGAETSQTLFDAEGAPFALYKRQFAVGEEPDWPQSEILWFLPLSGSGRINGEPFSAGECWLLSGTPDIALIEGCTALIATA